MHNGQVVAVWYRCQQLPYRVTAVDTERVAEMAATGQELPRITGIEVLDP